MFAVLIVLGYIILFVPSFFPENVFGIFFTENKTEAV